MILPMTSTRSSRRYLPSSYFFGYPHLCKRKNPLRQKKSDVSKMLQEHQLNTSVTRYTFR